MTIVIGLLCQDGVVVGTDSSATFSAGRMPTIEQPCEKIKIIDDHLIVTGTGPVGLGQRFTEIVKDYWMGGKFKGKTPIQSTKELCALGINDFGSTGAPKGTYGALIAFAANGQFNLCEFGLNDFQPELKTKDLCYVAMGSGQSIADPFIGFIRRVFWKNSVPRINGGIFAVLWALNHTIALNPGGINGPARIAVLENTKDGFRARLLNEAELSEHNCNAIAVETHLEQYKQILEGNVGSQDIPKAPLK